MGADELVSGMRLGGYRLVRVIGSGGMGVVWAAHDADLDREIALKVLRHGQAIPSLRVRLLREARAMARLKHPNVLTVFEVGTDEDRDFIAMELVDGTDLDAWLATKPPRDQIMEALLAAGRGLAAAHAAGLVHRDFKPHNVLRSNDGRILVTDFGLVRGLGDDAVQDTLDEHDETISGADLTLDESVAYRAHRSLDETVTGKEAAFDETYAGVELEKTPVPRPDEDEQTPVPRPDDDTTPLPAPDPGDDDDAPGPPMTTPSVLLATAATARFSNERDTGARGMPDSPEYDETLRPGTQPPSAASSASSAPASSSSSSSAAAEVDPDFAETIRPQRPDQVVATKPDAKPSASSDGSFDETLAAVKPASKVEPALDETVAASAAKPAAKVEPALDETVAAPASSTSKSTTPSVTTPSTTTPSTTPSPVVTILSPTRRPPVSRISRVSRAGRSRTDSVLDSPLTELGAMIGTPAYMAPEQFDGKPPDPRTDQFAYCVTAWQGLTGERPFRGETIEELRAAATKGIGDRDGGLPPSIRDILARGLSPKPEQRWPALSELLDALEAANRPPAPKRRAGWLVGGLGAAVAAAAIAIIAWPRDREAAAPAPAVIASPVEAAPCEPSEQLADVAWSPAIRDAERARVGAGAIGFEALAKTVDTYREAWIREHARICKTPKDPLFHSRVGCLVSQRDELHSFVLMARQLPPNAFRDRLPYGAVPSIATCLGPTPVAPPLLPAETAVRERIQKLRARGLLLVANPPEMMAQAESLLAEAKATGWAPVEAEIRLSIGTTAHRLGDLDSARAHLEQAVSLAKRTSHHRIAAISLVSLVEVEHNRSSDLSSTRALDRAIEEAREATERAGSDAHVEAILHMIVGGVMRSRGAPASEVRAEVDRARTKLLAAGDVRAIRATWFVVDAAAREHADNEAQIAAIASELEQRGFDPKLSLLDQVAADAAWLRRDLDEVHARTDKLATAEGAAPPSDGTPLKVRVFGPDGGTVEGARVVAWTGTLEGDSRRAFTDRRQLVGDTALSDARGEVALTIPAAGTVAVIAEQGELRARPIAVARGVTTLPVVLLSTKVITGTLPAIPGDRGRVIAHVPVANGTDWRIAALPKADRSYSIERVPSNAAIQIVRPSGVADRRTSPARAASHSTATIDVIVRGASTALPVKGAPEYRGEATHERVWLFGSHVTARTRADLERLAISAPDVTVGEVDWVGAATTDDGRRLYQKDDRNLVLRHVAEGPYTACVALGPAPNAATKCVKGTAGAQHAVLLELP